MTQQKDLATREQTLSRKKHLSLQKQLRTLQNEMAFIEILVQFWPWANMAEKLQRLEKKYSQLQQLQQQYRFTQPAANIQPIESISTDSALTESKSMEIRMLSNLNTLFPTRRMSYSFR